MNELRFDTPSGGFTVVGRLPTVNGIIDFAPAGPDDFELLYLYQHALITWLARGDSRPLEALAGQVIQAVSGQEYRLIGDVGILRQLGNVSARTSPTASPTPAIRAERQAMRESARAQAAEETRVRRAALRAAKHHALESARAQAEQERHLLRRYTGSPSRSGS